MKIIDWERRGNVVRFYLGADSLKAWHGDDWNDAPWEHNAGTVYDEFVRGHVDVAFAFDCEVREAGQDELNSKWCKDDFFARREPFLTVTKDGRGTWELFFGDSLDKLDRIRHLEAA